MDEKLELQNKIEELTYKNKDLTKKLELSHSFLNEKSEEYDNAVKLSSENKKKLAQCQSELETLKSSYLEETDLLREELERAKADCDEFEQLVKTKEKMLDDQITTINSLKAIISKKEKEIKFMNEEKENDSVKIYYENKLEEEYEKNHRLKEKNKQLSEQLQYCEEENEKLNQDNEYLSEEANTLKAKVDEKVDIIKIIEEQFNEVK